MEKYWCRKLINVQNINIFVAIILITTNKANGLHSTNPAAITTIVPVQSDEIVSEKIIAHNESNSDGGGSTEQYSQVNYATPATIKMAAHPKNNYDKGLEDYDEAVARVELKKEQIRQNATQLSPLEMLVKIISMAWDETKSTTKPSAAAAAPAPADVHQTEHSVETTTVAVREPAAQEEGRYIKGDPLKGYYDFIITEGSYKFWVVFQLATAVLILYSTFAAIYYSKVNPILSDYDYVTYLGGARSLTDDPNTAGNSGMIGNVLTTLSNNNLMTSAGHAFEFVMEAIDKMPHS